MFELLGKKLSTDVNVLKGFLEKQDENGNTALHLSAIEPITEENLKIITKMLQKGVNPAQKNKAGDTFLVGNMSLRLRQHINQEKDEWFANLIKNDELLKNFIELQDDDIFCSILKRFSRLTTTKGAVHPIELLDYIWMSRDVLKNSLNELLSWEGINFQFYYLEGGILGNFYIIILLIIKSFQVNIITMKSMISMNVVTQGLQMMKKNDLPFMKKCKKKLKNP